MCKEGRLHEGFTQKDVAKRTIVARDVRFFVAKHVIALPLLSDIS